MPEEDEMKSSDSGFSDALEEIKGARTVDGWTYVNNTFYDHHETPLKEFHEWLNICLLYTSRCV